MRRVKALRRTALALGLAVAGLLLLWVALPVWFPWLLRPLAAKAGIHYARYERLSYSRFAVTDLTFTNRATELQVHQFEALAPNAWLWRAWRRTETNHPNPFGRVNDWSLKVSPQASGKTTPVYATVRDWQSTLDTVARWVPQLLLSNGMVALPAGQFYLPRVGLTNGDLVAELEIPSLQQRAKVSLNLKRATVYRARVESDSLPLEANVDVSTPAQGLQLDGSALWLSNRVTFTARFTPTGSWPETARVDAPELLVPGAQVKLPSYRALRGSASFRWDNDQFSLDLLGKAEPLPATTNLPPVDVDLHVRGNTNSVVIQNAEVISPWLTMKLSEKVSLYRTGSILHEPANLDLTVDFSRQPWYPMEGVLRGEAQFKPAQGRMPSAFFELTGTNVSARGLETSSLGIHGTFLWPELQISSAAFAFEDGSKANLSGTLILPEKRLETGRFSLEGPLLQRWLPADYAYETLIATGHFNGPIGAVAHDARIQVTKVEIPGTKPFNATIVESGQRLNLERVEASIATGNSLLETRGAADLGTGTNATVRLQAFTLSQKDQVQLSLAQPAQVSLNWDSPRGLRSVSIGDFQWSGSGGQLQLGAEVAWPEFGRLLVHASNLSSTLFQDFVAKELAPAEVTAADLRAGWTNSPAILELRLSLREEREGALAASVDLSGDGRGVSVRELRLLNGTNVLLTAEGFLPLVFQPAAQGQLLDLRTNSPLHFKAQVDPSGWLWEEVARVSGLSFRDPRLRVELSGTLAAPHGEVEFQAEQAFRRATNGALPKLESLHAHIKVTPQEAWMDELSLRIQGQPVSATARMPLDAEFWNDLRRGTITGWEKATARIQIEDAELAAFAPLFPDLLAPQGQLNADVSLLPGLAASGELTIQNARTRPLGTWGPFRDIQLRVRFQDRSIRLQTGLARLGGAPVTLTGAVDLAGTDWVREGIPPFQFHLWGTNVPLARQPEFVIRSDLDLSVAKTNGAAALISGEARLRDSYYLSDLQALVPGKVATPQGRPPYFSVVQRPFADWRLDVHVTGDHFLQVRSALYNGQVSSNLRLQGTLKDPIALGDLSIDSGTVRFPFASLKVDHGLLTLTSDNPYHPTLNVLATTKQYGYDIRMEATGPVDSPTLQFSSTPPLNPEQIVLLVTAGELPRGEYSLTAQQRAQGLALFLARDLLARIGVGDSAEPRLIIRSGEQISQQGTPTYYIEYKLSDTWSLVGEYDRFGDVNAGAKWRVFSR